MNYTNIARYVWNGAKDRYWYAETKVAFAKLLPNKNTDLICDLFAATSPNASLKQNTTQALKALYQWDNELPFVGYSHNIICGLNDLRAGKELNGRKIRNFTNAMKGDRSAVVVDMWIMLAFGFESKNPTKKQYDVIEIYIREQAAMMSLQPREMCAMIWGGIRTERTGRANTTRYEHVLKQKFVSSLFDEKIQTKKHFYFGAEMQEVQA